MLCSLKVVNMTDSMFLMQRYWGSDAEDSTEEDKTKNSENYLHINGDNIKRQKLNTDIVIGSNVECIKSDSDVECIKSDSDVECIKSDSDVEYIDSKYHNSTENIEDVTNKLIKKTELEVKSIKKSRKKKSITNQLEKDEQSKIVEIKISKPQVIINESDANSEEITRKDHHFNASNEIKKQKTKLKSIEQLNQSKESELKVSNSDTSENFCTIGQIHQKDVKIKKTLPHWLSNPTYIGVNLQEEITPISELHYLDSNTKNNLKDAGISFLFPVQIAVIPWLIQTKRRCLLVRPSDICVSAPTGSGKTLAFVLPIVQSLNDRVVCAIRAVVVLPVSELAIQVYKVFETFIRGTDLKVALLTGQKSFAAEQNALVKSNGFKVQSLVDIVVTTPGRIYDHIYRTNGFCLKRLRYLVIDEADRMMEEIQQGWLKQVEDAVFQDCLSSTCVCSSINKRMPSDSSSAFNFGMICQPLQKLLYSATLTHDPEQLHSLSLYKPQLFSTSNSSSVQEYVGKCTLPDSLTMLQVICEEGMKIMVICHLIKKLGFKRVLCFTESVERAHRLHLILEKMGLLQVREISSFNRAVQRKIALEQFAAGKVDILVCSDLVARGIDIENIDCVISYDVPQFVKIYIHRIGRTARAGKSGTAITLLSDGEIPHFKKMLKSAEIEVPERINLDSESLKPLISSYQAALLAADAKIKKEKNLVQGKSSNKRKRSFVNK